MKHEKAWVWFKGGIKGGSWVEGFLASSCDEGGVIIERSDFVTCRVPEWRVSFQEIKDKKIPPEIPNDCIWKYI